MKEASEWVIENAGETEVLNHHAAASFWLYETEVKKLEAWGGYTPESLELCSGTLLIWDAHYSVQEAFGFTPERLQTAGWEVVETFAHKSVRIYRKK